MADDTEEETEDKAAEKPAGLMGKAISAVGIFVSVLAALVVAPLITNSIYGPPGGAQIVEDEAGESEEAVDGGDQMAADLPPALYQPLEPPMVINFEQADGSTRFLQMSLQVMARDEAAIDAVKVHLPAIRNSFLFLIGNRDYSSLSTVAGKEQLRAELLAAVQDVLEKNAVESSVEDIYFTSFVMQ